MHVALGEVPERDQARPVLHGGSSRGVEQPLDRPDGDRDIELVGGRTRRGRGVRDRFGDAVAEGEQLRAARAVGGDRRRRPTGDVGEHRVEVGGGVDVVGALDHHRNALPGHLDRRRCPEVRRHEVEGIGPDDLDRVERTQPATRSREQRQR